MDRSSWIDPVPSGCERLSSLSRGRSDAPPRGRPGPERLHPVQPLRRAHLDAPAADGPERPPQRHTAHRGTRTHPHTQYGHKHTHTRTHQHNHDDHKHTRTHQYNHDGHKHQHNTPMMITNIYTTHHPTHDDHKHTRTRQHNHDDHKHQHNTAPDP